MTYTSILPWIAGTLLVLFMAYGIYSDGKRIKNSWVIPACLSLFFFVFSLMAVISEGQLGFWTEHTRNMWGNQIWFDLLLAAGIGWFLILPQAKAQGMRLPFWGILIVATGCIGFTAMLARMLYLRDNSAMK